MKNLRSKTFNKYFNGLPSYIQKLAREKFKQFEKNPNHPGLKHKKTSVDDLWEVRISILYRAIYEKGRNVNFWHFIGTKPEFEKFLKHFRK